MISIQGGNVFVRLEWGGPCFRWHIRRTKVHRQCVCDMMLGHDSTKVSVVVLLVSWLAVLVGVGWCWLVLVLVGVGWCWLVQVV